MLAEVEEGEEGKEEEEVEEGEERSPSPVCWQAGVLGQAWAAVSGAVRALWRPVQSAAVQGLCDAGGAEQPQQAAPQAPLSGPAGGGTRSCTLTTSSRAVAEPSSPLSWGGTQPWPAPHNSSGAGFEELQQAGGSQAAGIALGLMEYSSAGDVDAGQQLPGLQGLPEQLLDAILSQMDESSRLQVFRTSKFLATALLRVVPRIQLTYPTQHDIIGQYPRELAPFLTEVLQNRQQPTLDLTLQPASSLTDAMLERWSAEPAAESAAEATRMVAWMLGAVPLCGALDSLTICWCEYVHFPWEAAFSATLAASFPSLTSLTFQGGMISIGQLAKAVNHPLLLPRLLHLDLQGIITTHRGNLGPSPFIGSRLQALSLCGRVRGMDAQPGFLSGLVPLPPNLTQLEVIGCTYGAEQQEQWDWVRIAAAVSSLTQLQQLKLLDGDPECIDYGPGHKALLQALAHLPSLHTLVVDDFMVGQEQLDALLALTQITRLKLYGFSGLTSSRASAACSWRQLKVRVLDWVSAAYLPLHSLTHPMRLHQLVKGIEEPSIELLAAAELNLCERNTADPVLDKGMVLSHATVDLLTEQYLAHSRRAAQQPLQSTAASSSNSGPSSSRPEGHITPGGPGSITEQGGQQGSAAGGQALMQRLGRPMNKSSEDEVCTSQQLQGLQGLPAELLGAVLSQLDASSLLQVFRTSKFLATSLLRWFPRIQLTYPTQCDILGQHLRELAPFLTEVLQNRQQPTLHLTLQPAIQLTEAIQQRHRAEPAAAASDATHLVSWMLGAVPLCGAVDCLSTGLDNSLHLPWQPSFSAALAASFPSLTSLTFKNEARMGRMSIGHLAVAINHPLLLPRLLHLDIQGIITAHEGQPGRSPFIGSKLQKLSLNGWVQVDREPEFLSGLLPLPSTLTQLDVNQCLNMDVVERDWVRLAAAVRSLTQLRELRFFGGNRDPNATGPGLMALLPALAHLPSLHTLVINNIVVGQEQLDALLALTHITRLEVHAFSGLTSSRASAACSWRQLTVWVLDWDSAAYLPLHSLTHPLWVQELVKGIEELRIEVLAAAEHNLCESNKAGLVLDGNLWLSRATVDLLTEQYLSHSRRTAQQPTQPTVASSSHSGPSTSLPSSSHSGACTSLSSSSLVGCITPGGQGISIGPGGLQGVSSAGGQALMQRLGRCVKVLHIEVQGLVCTYLTSNERQALAVLFPTATIGFDQQW
ncbi:hypothetical protein QJQ45_003914 [Haematococcus lacustris]|nr:hypothetical protein QJQ45_003914 [Haematococcus lacustris]